MKWLVLAILAVAASSSVLWYEAAERKFTPSQSAALGMTALTGWALVIFLGAVM